MPHISPQKARKILRDKEVKGKPLTKAQKGFFGARAGGQPVKGLMQQAKAIKRKMKK